MKSRILATIMTAALVGSLLTGCGGSAGGNSTTDTAQNATTDESASTGEETAQVTESSGEEVEITFFHYLEQFQSQFDTLIAMYKEVKPNVTLKVECIGGDYDKILQTRVATGEVPDIFASGPYTKNEVYSSVSYDLTNEDFIKDIEIGPEYIASNGEMSAFPFRSEAWGILYNMDLFEQTGITELPETLQELEEVCETLKTAGITPFAQGYNSSYVKSQLFGFPYAVDDNFLENIEKLSAKEVHLKDFEFIGKIFDMAGLIGKYTQENPFDDDFASAAARLGLGEAAMMTQGDWGVENALKANPDARIGMMALPMSDNPEDAKVYLSASIGLHINKDSAHLSEVLEFADWLVTSQETKDWISKDLKALSAINGVSPEGSQALNDAIKYREAGKTVPWGSSTFPSGVGSELDPSIDKFLLGEMSKEDAIEEMDRIWATFE